jgi:hypothetical protein
MSAQAKLKSQATLSATGKPESAGRGQGAKADESAPQAQGEDGRWWKDASGVSREEHAGLAPKHCRCRSCQWKKWQKSLHDQDELDWRARHYQEDRAAANRGGGLLLAMGALQDFQFFLQNVEISPQWKTARDPTHNRALDTFMDTAYYAVGAMNAAIKGLALTNQGLQQSKESTLPAAEDNSAGSWSEENWSHPDKAKHTLASVAEFSKEFVKLLRGSKVLNTYVENVRQKNKRGGQDRGKQLRAQGEETGRRVYELADKHAKMGHGMIARIQRDLAKGKNGFPPLKITQQRIGQILKERMKVSCE